MCKYHCIYLGRVAHGWGCDPDNARTNYVGPIDAAGPPADQARGKMNYIRHGIGQLLLRKLGPPPIRFLKGLIDDHFQVLCQKSLEAMIRAVWEEELRGNLRAGDIPGPTPQWWDIKRRSNIAWWKIFRTPASDMTCIRLGGGIIGLKTMCLPRGRAAWQRAMRSESQLRPVVFRSSRIEPAA